jgi:hypothetical protein
MFYYHIIYANSKTEKLTKKKRILGLRVKEGVNSLRTENSLFFLFSFSRYVGIRIKVFAVGVSRWSYVLSTLNSNALIIIGGAYFLAPAHGVYTGNTIGRGLSTTGV